MPDKKQLNEEQLEKVTGGDEYDELAKMAAQEAAERQQAELEKQITDLENYRTERNNTDLNDSINNLIDMLKKIYGQDNDNDTTDSDGHLHIG